MKRVLFILLSLSISIVNSQTLFEDDASIAGLTQHTGQMVNGNGLSFVDYDGDGWDDITLPSGNGVPLRFYKNFNGFFVEETLLSQPIYYRTRSVSWVDFDNDGDKDLFVASDDQGNRLFERKESGFLADITTAVGLPEDNLQTYGVSWGDINNDGCLDLYLSNRVSESVITNYLFQNNCDGTFTNVTDAIGLTNTSAITFCASFFDFNNDGWQDLYVSNDKQFPNFLYKNNGDGTFIDVSESSGTGIIVDAMSVTIDDFNSDGYFDIYITNTPNIASTPTLGSVMLKNNGDETFSDVSLAVGTQLDSWSWGANFLDAENDGDLDLYVSCSYISSDGLPSYAFFQNESDGTFSIPSEVGFVNNEYRSYGSAIGDSNNDGKTDIVVNNGFDTLPNLWNNKSTTENNYLTVNLIGTTSNRDAIGSVIEIALNGNKQYRYVINGESYLSQNSLKEFFGLGTNIMVDYVKVKWLSGSEDILYNVSANQTLNIIEGSTLSVEEYSFNEQISVFPNPVVNEINIISKELMSKIVVYDSRGQQVNNYEAQRMNFKIDTTKLSHGIYFIKVYGNSFNEITFKLIKN